MSHPPLQHGTSGGRVWHRRMLPRSRDEEHRASTPLELFFDLVFVVAIASAASTLHHALSAGHIGHGVLGYAMVFFGIWLAWLNFTWFASAYDTDDAVYRLTTMVQMAGAIVLAAGIARAAEHADFTVVYIGFVIMRVAMITQWLRAAFSDPTCRATALRYAGGIFVCQLWWVLLVLVPPSMAPLVYLVGAPAELAVPVVAERVRPTNWHPEHIAERYGLLTIIVLGEVVLSTTTSLQAAFASGATAALIGLAVVGLVSVFGMWWLYFSFSAHHFLSTSDRVSFLWGYGHLVLYAATAAFGAGLGVAVDVQTQHAHVSATAAGYATALPAAIYLVSVWVLQVRVCPEEHGVVLTGAYPVAAVLVLAAPWTPVPVAVIAAVIVVLVVLTVVSGRRVVDGTGGDG